MVLFYKKLAKVLNDKTYISIKKQTIVNLKILQLI